MALFRRSKTADAQTAPRFGTYAEAVGHVLASPSPVVVQALGSSVRGSSVGVEVSSGGYGEVMPVAIYETLARFFDAHSPYRVSFLGEYWSYDTSLGCNTPTYVDLASEAELEQWMDDVENRGLQIGGISVRVCPK